MTITHEFSAMDMRRLESNRKLEAMIESALEAAHAECAASTRAAHLKYNHAVESLMTLRYQSYLEAR